MEYDSRHQELRIAGKSIPFETDEVNLDSKPKRRLSFSYSSGHKAKFKFMGKILNTLYKNYPNPDTYKVAHVIRFNTSTLTKATEHSSLQYLVNQLLQHNSHYQVAAAHGSGTSVHTATLLMGQSPPASRETSTGAPAPSSAYGSTQYATSATVQVPSGEVSPLTPTFPQESGGTQINEAPAAPYSMHQEHLSVPPQQYGYMNQYSNAPSVTDATTFPHYYMTHMPPQELAADTPPAHLSSAPTGQTPYNANSYFEHWSSNVQDPS
jgi:hypothetical protein